MKTSVSEFSEFWQGRSLPARPGVTPQSIAEFEARYEVTLPKDMQELWRIMDGADGVYKGHLTFWELQQLRPVPEIFTGANYQCVNPECPPGLPNASSYFVFSDYLISAFFYAIRLGNEAGSGQVVFLDGDNWYPCADNFSMFLDSYIREASASKFFGFLPELIKE